MIAVTSADKRFVGAVTMLVTFIAFTLRIIHLDTESFWRDEIDSAWFAQQSLAWSLANLGRPGWNGALYQLALHWWARQVGLTEFGLRFSSVIAGVLLVPLVFALGRRMLGQAAGLIGALLAALSPYLVWYAQELKMYALLACLSAASVLVLHHCVYQRRAWPWAVFALLAVATVLTHVMGLLLLPVWAGVILIADNRRAAPQQLLLLATIGVVPLALLSFWPLSWWLQRMGATGEGMDFHLSQMVASSVIYFGLNGANITGLVGTGVTIFLLAAAAFVGWSFRDPRTGYQPPAGARRGRLLVWLYCLGPVVGLAVIGWHVPLFADRYLMISVPAFMLLLASGLLALRQFGRLPFLALTLALIVVLVAELVADYRTPSKTDYRAAAAILRREGTPGATLIMVSGHAERAMRYYGVAGLQEVALPALTEMSEARVAGMLTASPAMNRRVWLMESDRHWADPAGRVRVWLKNRCGEPLRAHHLTQLDLYYYHCPRSGEPDAQSMVRQPVHR